MDRPRACETLADGIGWMGYPLEPLATIRNRRVRYGVEQHDSCGVYFLFLRWVLLYVGRTTRINTRLRQHYETNAIPFTHLAFIPCPMLWHDEIEADYIRALRPRYNIALKP